MRFAYSQVENLNEAEMCVYNYIVKNLKTYIKSKRS